MYFHTDPACQFLVKIPETNEVDFFDKHDEYGMHEQSDNSKAGQLP